MTDQPYTPTTEQVRFAATFPNENFSLKGSDFDRWLAERDARIRAAAEQRGAALAQAVRGVLDVLDDHPAPRKEADPTGYATTRLELLEHRVREAIQEVLGGDDDQ